VVVVGSGGAGLCAAAAAARAGARVMLVTKGKAGRGNSTAYAGGGFTVACGGALIDVTGRVLGRDREPIDGLFACGEVTGGVDGANRVGGNALTNIVVFGLAAGEAAARYSTARYSAVRHATARHAEMPTARAGTPWALCVTAPPTAPGARPGELRRELQALADAHLGPVRSAEGLGRALDGLARLERRVAVLADRARAGLEPAASEALLALELPGAVATAAFVARAALERRESRGVHFREDYPAEDEAWSERHVIL